MIRTQSDFEHSQFCDRYRCREQDQWAVSHGDMNHIYASHSVDLGVDMQDNPTRNPPVTGFGLSFYNRDHLSAEDFDSITLLVRSSDQAINHDKTISFITANVEKEVSCTTCALDDSANFVTDGDYHVWAGKVGAEQIIDFRRVVPHS